MPSGFRPAALTAPAGQVRMHAPQPMHWSMRRIDFCCRMRMARVGADPQGGGGAAGAAILVEADEIRWSAEPPVMTRSPPGFQEKASSGPRVPLPGRDSIDDFVRVFFHVRQAHARTEPHLTLFIRSRGVPGRIASSMSAMPGPPSLMSRSQCGHGPESHRRLPSPPCITTFISPS